MRREQVKDLIKDAIIQSIRKCGANGYIQSQAVCPVKTGYLKSTGNVIDIDKGIQLQWTASYSSEVERGWKGGRIHVSSYSRKDGTRVKEYDYVAPPREGQHYIENPLKTSFESLNIEFDKELNSHFSNIKRV